MSVNTILLVSTRWELEDIKTVIESHLNTKVKVRDCSNTSIGMFNFDFKIGDAPRSMYVHTHHRTPLGNATYLSLGWDNQAVKIMKTIASVLGGLLNPKDYDEKYEHIDGLFTESNGLSYFLKHSIIHKYIDGENDLVGLNKSIHKWNNEMDKGNRTDMNLFEVKS